MTTEPKKIGRPATGRNPRVALVLPRALLARVDQRAADEFAPRNDVIRDLLEIGLKDHGKETKRR